jgi:hypothetical protein
MRTENVKLFVDVQKETRRFYRNASCHRRQGVNDMAYSSIAISSSHSTKCQGAVGLINEVKEATRVVDRVTDELRAACLCRKFHDTVSDDQSENLNRIVDWHNSKVRQPTSLVTSMPIRRPVIRSAPRFGTLVRRTWLRNYRRQWPNRG